jgi:hypothetical protein
MLAARWPGVNFAALRAQSLFLDVYYCWGVRFCWASAKRASPDSAPSPVATGVALVLSAKACASTSRRMDGQ